MTYEARPLRLFGQKTLTDLFNLIRAKMQGEIRQQPANDLLNANEDDLVAHYFSKYSFTPITFHWDQQTITLEEKSIQAEHFPGQGFAFNVQYGRSYTKNVVTYHVPYSGDKELLVQEPRSGPVGPMAFIGEHAIGLDVVDFYDDAQKLKAEYETIAKQAKSLCESVRIDVEEFNRDLEKQIRAVIEKRKAEYLKQANLLASLDVPIKKSESTPQSITVPTVKRKLVVQKPVVQASAFKPEPTIAQSVYNEILTAMHNVGEEMERRPALYKGQDEPGLRDYFLVMLNMNFDSATGEAFNKGGKTDILVRHDSSYVFVAECKVWDGKKKYHEAIDQLFGYLTWRDSKAAVVLFVNNKELSGVLKTVEEETPKHGCFVKDKGKVKEGWYSYEFHLPTDNNRHVSVTVLIFHFPTAAPDQIPSNATQ